MAHRGTTGSYDRSIFARTAMKTKRINVKPKISRGGNMSIKYKGFSIEKAKGTEFGKPTFVKYGKEYDIQEYIEAGREDTEIIPCLEKYGCLKPMELNAEGLYGDFTVYNDLRSTCEKKIQIENMWNQLDTKVKNEFNNDMNEFIDRGMEWAKKRVEAEKATAQPAPSIEPEKTKGE